MQEMPVRQRPRRGALYIIIVLFVLLLVALGGAYYFYQQSHTDPQENAQSELEATIAQVGKLMVLPENETPTLATVSDPEKLQDQAFFVHAKKGDKVLIYSLAKKAILYDPVSNKIVEVAPVNLGEGQQQ